MAHIPRQQLPRAKEAVRTPESPPEHCESSGRGRQPDVRVQEVRMRMQRGRASEAGGLKWRGRSTRSPRVQVWSSHSAFLGALQVWTSTAFLHSLQRTAQHQWNLHSHWVMRVTRVVS